MALSEITRSGVLAAVAEHDALGRDEFLRVHGFGPAREYFLVHDGRYFDSKAICGVAHGYDFPASGPLRAEDFSGGADTVAAVLTRLGFSVERHLPKREVLLDDGTAARATFSVVRQADHVDVIFYARGVSKSKSPVNPGYAEGLRLVLSRMASANTTLLRALVDSSEVAHLPADKRSVAPDVPVRLADIQDIGRLAQAMERAAAAVRTSGATSAGNRTKRLRFSVLLPNTLDVQTYVEALAGGPSVGRAFALTWNPDRWPIAETWIQTAIDTTDAGRIIEDRWATGVRSTGIHVGDRVYLLRQGTDRGIVAQGRAVTEIFQADHFDRPSESANYINVEWDRWVPLEDRLRTEDLVQIAPRTNWNQMYSSGQQIDPLDVAVLAAAFEVVSPAFNGDEVTEGLWEGAKRTVTVNRYERDRSARDACITIHGSACAACGVDFGRVYGEFASGFIHVHHLNPISTIGESYQVNPASDLVPVCPNCHAMLHYRAQVPRTIDELRARMAEVRTHRLLNDE